MKYFFFIITISTIITSCSTFSSCGSDKEAYITNLTDFVKKVSEENKNSPISDWSNYDKKIEQFTGECYEQYKDNLDNLERLQIATNTGTYLYNKYGIKLVFELNKQGKNIKRALDAVDPILLGKVAVEIIKNPTEIQNIMNDLEKRYDN